MQKKVWIGIVVFWLVLITVLLVIMGIERNMTSKALQEKQVSAQITKDTIPPVITLKGSKELTIKEGETYKEAGYTAKDNVDGSIVQKVKIAKQTINDEKYKLIYTVTDAAGNIAQAERIVNIQKGKEAKTESKTENKSSTSQETANKKNTTSKEATANKRNTSNKKNTTTSKNNASSKKTTTNKNTSGKKTTTTTNKNSAENKNSTTTNKEATSQKNGVIYLTFDDGPSTSSTPKILDILKKHNVKATFFLLNYNSSTEYLVKREAKEGHSIGIHGYSHSYKNIYQSEQAYIENLNKLQTKIYKTTGIKTTITRFPGGSSNTVSKFNPGIMTRLSKLVVEKGYTYYDWNISSGDAGGAKNADQVYNNVTKRLSKNGRNIVLMHDFSGNKKTINALERIIEYGKANGYTFKTITADTPMMKHKINN